MPEPTPAPWTVAPVHYGFKIYGPDKRRTGRATIADVLERYGEGQANAHLMAASQDLLAACEAALAALTYPPHKQLTLGAECAPEHEDLVLQLRLAIRKARPQEGQP